MAKEIERRFLVKKELLPALEKLRFIKIKQGYISSEPVVRVRLSKNWDGFTHAELTVKGPGLEVRDEYEFRFGDSTHKYKEAKDMYHNLCNKGKVVKTRYIIDVPYDYNLHWEIDVFEGDNEGLVLAEMEFPEEGYDFEAPEWLGEEITEDPRYTNVQLALNPYKNWAWKRD